MKRTKLESQYNFLEPRDLATLNVGRATLDVFELGTDKLAGRHKLTPLTVDLIRHAYECGLNKKALF